jgi:hypothetical protein
VHFYELHEGDGEVYSDLLLFREDEMNAERFFELVQDIRRRIQDSFDHDTLIEAIAEELERDHDFVFISDDRLTAAVNVSRDDDDNFLADLSESIDEDGDFRSIRAELDADARLN